MLTCSHCAGFVPASLSSCPNCAQPLGRKALRAAKQLAKVGAAAATMMTLMACYGAGYPREVNEPALPSTNDRDADGFEAAPPGAAPSPAYDCDDTSPAVHPGANDPTGDALDQNCDGMDGSATSPAAPTATMAAEPPPETKPQPPAIAK
jgi:hypothetical protein